MEFKKPLNFKSMDLKNEWPSYGNFEKEILRVGHGGYQM